MANEDGKYAKKKIHMIHSEGKQVVIYAIICSSQLPVPL